MVPGGTPLLHTNPLALQSVYPCCNGRLCGSLSRCPLRELRLTGSDFPLIVRLLRRMALGFPPVLRIFPGNFGRSYSVMRTEKSLKLLGRVRKTD